jgi:hypothetical protein
MIDANAAQVAINCSGYGPLPLPPPRVSCNFLKEGDLCGADQNAILRRLKLQAKSSWCEHFSGFGLDRPARKSPLALFLASR